MTNLDNTGFIDAIRKAKMRKVKIFKWDKVKGKGYVEKVDDGVGYFHAWGVDYEEMIVAAGNYSTAIIETVDGTVRNIPVDLIQFIDPIDEGV